MVLDGTKISIYEIEPREGDMFSCLDFQIDGKLLEWAPVLMNLLICVAQTQ